MIYVVKVVQETMMEVEADSEDEAIQEACNTYMDYDANSVDAEVIAKRSD